MSEVRTRRTYGDTGTDVVIRLSEAEAAALGGDAETLARWLSDVLDALAGLRTGRWADDPDTARTGAYWAIVAGHTRLAPRLRGVVDAAIRAHQAAGGSVRHLAAALDAAHPSGAQYRRTALPDQPGAWETWATSGGPQQHTKSITEESEDTTMNYASGNARVGSQIGSIGTVIGSGDLSRLGSCKCGSTSWTDVRTEGTELWATCARCGIVRVR